MAESILVGDIEAFPSNDDIFITFSAMDNSEDYFESNLPRDENILSAMLKELRVSEDSAYSKPCRNYEKLARMILHKNIHTVYCPKDNVTAILSNLEKDLTPADEFPGEEHSFSDSLASVPVYEHIYLKVPTTINNRFIEKNKEVVFTHSILLSKEL